MSTPGTTTGFGTREFIFLLAKLIAEYLRHETKIDPDLSSGVRAALAALIEALPALLELNPPGPE